MLAKTNRETMIRYFYGVVKTFLKHLVSCRFRSGKGLGYVRKETARCIDFASESQYDGKNI